MLNKLLEVFLELGSVLFKNYYWLLVGGVLNFTLILLVAGPVRI